MSNLNNEEILERLHQQLHAQDSRGLLDDEVNTIAREHGLHADDDRDEVIWFIAESIFYNFYT